jgi:hypothetical protein
MCTRTGKSTGWPSLFFKALTTNTLENLKDSVYPIPNRVLGRDSVLASRSIDNVPDSEFLF